MATEHLFRRTTPEGLVPTSLLMWEGGVLRLVNSGEQVWFDPMLDSVMQVLKASPHLWRIAQVRVVNRPMGQKRAPIFGVPFDVALDQVSSFRNPRGQVKSMFKRLDGTLLHSTARGVVATMVAHVAGDVGTDGREVSLEAWQVLDVDAETFYLHGRFVVSKSCFVHFDGATMFHSDEAKRALFDRGVKQKGREKKKHFRLDGDMSVDDVRALGAAFLPLEDLATEYLLIQRDSGDA